MLRPYQPPLLRRPKKTTTQPPTQRPHPALTAPTAHAPRHPASLAGSPDLRSHGAVTSKDRTPTTSIDGQCLCCAQRLSGPIQQGLSDEDRTPWSQGRRAKGFESQFWSSEDERSLRVCTPDGRGTSWQVRLGTVYGSDCRFQPPERVCGR